MAISLNEACLVVIVVSGLALAGAGAFLAKRQLVGGLKPHAIWMTYLTSVALVLLGRPGSVLSKFGFTAKGLEVAFAPVDAQSGEASAAKEASRALAVVTFKEAAALGGGPGHSLATSADVSRLLTQFSDYFASLGFIPAQLGANNFLQPGMLIYFEDGRPMPLLAPNSAFPTLQALTATATAPRFSSVLEDSNRKFQLEFEIEGASVSQAATSDLETSLSDAGARALALARPAYVVQAVFIADRSMVGAKEETGESMKAGDRSSNSLLFKSETPNVLAYRLMRVVPPGEVRAASGK